MLVLFLHGLALFAMGLAVALESRRDSALALARNLRWLAAFGLTHALADWSGMFLLSYQQGPLHEPFATLRTVMLPVPSLLLVRFGIGLIRESGDLPDWLTFVPIVVVVPLAFLLAYALTVAVTAPRMETPVDVWSRYLLYFPGNLLAMFGFIRQWRRLPTSALGEARRLLLAAGLAFLFNAIVAGLVVPDAPYGLAPWLNYHTVQALTGIPIEVWRMLVAFGLSVFVIRALNLFDAERNQHIAELQRERTHAQQAALQAHMDARQVAENWTDGLVNISRHIANMDSIDNVLVGIVDLARRLLKSDTAAIGLWDKTGARLEMKCYATATGIVPVDSSPVTADLILWPVRACRSSRFPDDTGGYIGQWICPVVKRQIQAAAIVPLQLDGEPVGGLWVGRYELESYTEADITGLEHLADQAVIALEHALMASRLQSLAVIDERSRIAREMHDSLAQILGYLSLQMQTLEALVGQGDSERILDELRQARRGITAAQADVRENILSLRTTLAGDVGLIAALQQYIEEFGLQTGIEARLVSDLSESPSVSPLGATQLVRIVQEALTNVRKHAQADHVEVRLTAQGGCLCVSITDDGIGFDGQAASYRHFGLQTMQERAESVGGALILNSSPGTGTRIELSVPMLEQSDYLEKEL